MSVILCPQIHDDFFSAENFDIFFAKSGAGIIKKLYEPREQPITRNPSESCKTNLFFGFFFDGTRNNYKNDESTKAHSNVARLYDCYPGQSVPGVLPKSANWQYQPSRYTHFFKVYVPGVASPFPQANDSGEGWEKTAGAAGGKQGERRIIWALIQAVNNVHRYFLKAPLVSQSEVDWLLRGVTLNKNARSIIESGIGLKDIPPSLLSLSLDMTAAAAFQLLLRRLHTAVARHWPDERTGKPAKTDPGVVKTIYLSIFGFSRGATEARAFANWLQSLCRLDARLRGKGGQMSLGGFPVEFDFLGLFDTVASVGLANSAGYFDGHGAWADAEESLRVPSGLKCLHLVAAHELRRSFPVDSISVKGVLPDGCEEIVVPGVHSDVGGGYCPCEQGRGINPNGDDMLARIPLLMMYKTARLNGVPLKLELASASAKEKFALKPEMVAVFNAYIASCKETQGPIHRIMREQARKQIEWRLFRRITGNNPLQISASFHRASTFHQNDLHSAAQDFEAEIAAFLSWLNERGKLFKPAAQRVGFDNSYTAEWEEIATWWNERPTPNAEVQKFFDEYVHDSRASFKLTGPENKEEMHAQLKRWVNARQQQKLPVLVGKADYPSPPVALSPEQQRAVDDYVRTGKLPRMLVGGREPGRAGYLRFRKIYGGGDAELLS